MNDRFATIEGWWLERNANLLTEPAAVVSSYARMRAPLGGAGGSFHYENNDGYGLFQVVVGDFDVVADVQCLNYAETDIPPNDGNAHAFGLACHNFCQPENFGAGGSRDYYHRVITNAPTGRDSSARMVSEWKYTVAAVTTWNTIDGQELGTAGSLGGDFSERGGRWWVRVRRVGSTFTSWDAPWNAAGTVPTESEWDNEHSQTVSEIRELALVGLVLYSSDSSAGVTGRCRALLNYNIEE